MNLQRYSIKILFTLLIFLITLNKLFSQIEKVRDVIMAQAGYYGVDPKTAAARTEEYLKKLGIWEKRDVFIRELSGGQIRRVMIIKALIHEPELLILDEPTAGVDIELRRGLWDFLIDINKSGTTIILTTHYLEEAENLCRNIAIIDHGKIIENTSMKSLLKMLDRETFVLDLSNEIDACPEIEGYSISLKDQNQIEVEIPKSESLNELFSELSKKNISIISMRNKTNRLEELFLGMVEKNLGQESQK